MGKYKHIVIFGAGPIGLYMAIQLARMGLKGLTVVDPRAGVYTRPGVLDRSIFENTGVALKQDVPYSSSRHIKDFERSLYKIARTLHIKIITAKFISFDHQQAIIEDEQNQTQQTIPCDLAFDATGQKRALVQYANNHHGDQGTAPFKIEPIPYTQQEHHLVAYVKMKDEHSTLFKTRAKQENAQDKILILEEMHTRYGWNKFCEPDMHYQILNKDKICLYCELPMNLPEKDEESWLKLVLQLKSGSPDIQFAYVHEPKKYNRKPSFMSFSLNLLKTSPTYYEGTDLPMIIPIGDAHIEPDYRINIGIRSGIPRVNMALKSCTLLDNGSLELNAPLYEYLMGQQVGEHIKQIQDLHEERIRYATSIKSLENNINEYESVLKKVNPPEDERKIIVQGLTRQQKILLEKHNENAKNAFQKKLYHEALAHYQSMLTIHESAPQLKTDNEVLKLYSNLALCLKKIKNYPGAIEIAKKAISDIQEKESTEPLLKKIKFTLCSALLEQMIIDIGIKKPIDAQQLSEVKHMLQALNSIDANEKIALEKRLAIVMQNPEKNGQEPPNIKDSRNQ